MDFKHSWLKIIMPLQKLSHPIIMNVVRFFFISIRPSSLKRTPEECVHQNMTRLVNASRICDLDSDLSNGFKTNNFYPRPRNIYSIDLLSRPSIHNLGWVKRKNFYEQFTINKKSKFQSPDVETCKTNDSWLELPSDLAANLL